MTLSETLWAENSRLRVSGNRSVTEQSLSK